MYMGCRDMWGIFFLVKFCQRTSDFRRKMKVIVENTEGKSVILVKAMILSIIPLLAEVF